MSEQMAKAVCNSSTLYHQHPFATHVLVLILTGNINV